MLQKVLLLNRQFSLKRRQLNQTKRLLNRAKTIRPHVPSYFATKKLRLFWRNYLCYEVKTNFKAKLDYQKAKEGTRILLRPIRMIILLPWTHTVFPFQREKQTKDLKQTTIMGPIMGTFLCKYEVITQASSVQGKSFAFFFNHCFLREDKFGAAEVNGKLQMHFAR